MPLSLKVTPIPLSSIEGREVWKLTLGRASPTQVIHLVSGAFPMVVFAVGDKAI